MRLFTPLDTSIWRERFGNGSDGAKVVSADETYDGANAGLVGSYIADPLTLHPTITLDAASTFANGQLVMIHQTRGTGAGNREYNKIRNGGGTTGLELEYPLEHNYVDDGGTNQAQIVQMKQWSSLTIDATFTLSCAAWDGNKGGIGGAFVTGNIAINGVVSGIGKGFRGATVPGDGGGAGGQGESPAGDRNTRSQSANGPGGGGEKQAVEQTGGGGGGGHGTEGSVGQGNSTDRGAGGSTCGDADLTNANLGSGGGCGGYDGSGGDRADGNDGGGFWDLIFGGTCTIDNSTGGFKVDAETNTGSGGVNISGGGGGSAGSGELKGKNLVLNTTRATAQGKAGRSPAGPKAAGGPGGDGRLAAHVWTISGTTSPAINTTISELYSDLYANEGALSPPSAPLQQHKFTRQMKIASI